MITNKESRADAQKERALNSAIFTSSKTVLYDNSTTVRDNNLIKNN